MKNILKTILFILILFTSIITVKGNSYNMLKKLYIVEGSYDTLFYPGYQLIESNIDYDQEGIYTATYLEDITDRKFIRELEVISKDNILKNGIKNINLKEEFSFTGYKVLKRVSTSLVDVFVLEDEDNVCLKFKYQDEEKELILNNNINFVDLCFNKELNKLYFVGQILFESSDIYIAEIALNCEILKEKVISGSKVDLVNSLVYSNNYLYLSGSTTSNDLDFNHVSYNEDSFIMQLDINNFEIVNYLNLGELGIDFIVNLVYLDNLYVIKHYYSLGVHVVKIYEIDEELNILNTNYLGTITNVTDISLKIGNNNIYYFCSVYNESINDDEQVLYQINKNLSIKKIDTYYDPFARGTDMNIVKDEISLLYTSSSIEENYPTYLRVINDFKVKFTLDNRIYDKCYFNEFGNLDLLYKDKIKSYEYSLVYLKTLGSTNYNENIDPLIMCNNEEINSNKYLSNTDIDSSTFGNYSLLYYYNFDFFDLVYRKDIKVLSELKIEDNNIYTKGLILEFKGVGYLNDSIIESGYIIKDPGEYHLVLIGKEQEKEEYNFEVVENISKKAPLQNQNLELVFKEESSNTLNDVLVKTNNPSNYIVESDFASNIWYIIIPILTLIISLSTTLFLGRKIR